MSPNTKLAIFCIVALALVDLSLSQKLQNDETCHVLEGNGVRVDQCDGTKLLACTNGRCQCSDPVNQVFTFRNEEITEGRVKRSPKMGRVGGGRGLKNFAVGAVAGAATMHIASKIGHSTSSKKKSPKYQKVYSCFSRVGGQCSLNNHNWESVSSSSTTTSTTTAAPASNNGTSTSASTSHSTTTATTTSASHNGTATAALHTTLLHTTSAPVTTAAVRKTRSNPDISKIPRCVQNAVCRPSSSAARPSNNNGNFLQTVNFDPRIGVCECEAGYTRTSHDLCVKKNGAGIKSALDIGSMLGIMIVTPLYNKMF